MPKILTDVYPYLNNVTVCGKTQVDHAANVFWLLSRKGMWLWTRARRFYLVFVQMCVHWVSRWTQDYEAWSGTITAVSWVDRCEWVLDRCSLVKVAVRANSTDPQSRCRSCSTTARGKNWIITKISADDHGRRKGGLGFGNLIFCY